MKRYLVYFDKSPQNGIDAVDYVSALRKAKAKSPKGRRSRIRVRLANKGLLKSLANQGNY